MSKNTPEAKVDAFLESPEARKRRGGMPCQTCAHPESAAIDRMLRHFADKRATRETTLAWRSFIELAVIKDPEIKINLKWRAILRHTEDCLGIETR